MALLPRGTPEPWFTPHQGPVVVGGLGGSGTRIVAELLRHMGVHTGTDLNKAGDNKWFTLLCKLPRWDLDEAGVDAQSIARSLGMLEGAMTGQLLPTRAERRWVDTVVTRAASHHDRLHDDRSVEWLRDRATSLLRSRRHPPDGARRWGWKEPNSHVFLPHLHRHFGDRLRYVHVIRHGVYMAYSRNQSQVSRWGPQFGIADAATPSPSTSLDYWIAANELATRRGRAMPTGTFLLVNHDALCARPREGVASLVDFLGVSVSGPAMDALVSLPNPPKPLGMTVQEMEDEFGAERLTRVRSFGFALGDAA